MASTEQNTQNVPTTFAEMMALFAETDRRMEKKFESEKLARESAFESEKLARETAFESEKLARETAMKASDIVWNERMTKINAELNKSISKLGNRFGDVIEHLVAPNLLAKFAKLGYDFKTNTTNFTAIDDDGNTIAELDVYLENGVYAMAVEIKTHPNIEDVKDQIKRLNKMREFPRRFHIEDRKLLGALAGGILSSRVKSFALKEGLFILEQSGDTMDINKPDVPKEW